MTPSRDALHGFTPDMRLALEAARLALLVEIAPGRFASMGDPMGPRFSRESLVALERIGLLRWRKKAIAAEITPDGRLYAAHSVRRRRIREKLFRRTA